MCTQLMAVAVLTFLRTTFLLLRAWWFKGTATFLSTPFSGVSHSGGSQVLWHDTYPTETHLGSDQDASS